MNLPDMQQLEQMYTKDLAKLELQARKSTRRKRALRDLNRAVQERNEFIRLLRCRLEGLAMVRPPEARSSGVGAVAWFFIGVVVTAGLTLAFS